MPIKQTKKLKIDSSLLFLSLTLVLVLSSVVVYFIVKKFVFNEAGIFVATPTGVATLQVTPNGNVNMTPGETKTFDVVINNIPAGKSISAIGFSLRLATGVTASNLTINSALDTQASAKNFDFPRDTSNQISDPTRLNYVVATQYANPFVITNGTKVATFTLKAPTNLGTVSNVVTSISTDALPSIVDSTGAELMSSINSFNQAVNINVVQPTLANPTFNITTDTVYNTSTSVSIDVAGITGETIKYCTTTSNTTACTPSVTATPGIAFNFTNASPVYLYAEATLTGYTSSKAYSPKLTLNDNPTVASVTYVNNRGNTNLISGDTVTLTANSVNDTINGVTKVSFYIDTTLLSEDNSAPYTANVSATNLTIGNHTFKAEASDAFGGKGSSTTSVTVKPKAPTFTPNGGTSATPFSVTITNSNGTGTIKYSLGDNVTPATTYSAPVQLSTSNKITANVTVGTTTSDNAVSNQFTVTGKVAAPVFTPIGSSYYYKSSDAASWTFVKVASATTGAISAFCINEDINATTCTNYQNYTEGTTEIAVKTNFKIFAKATKTDWTDSDVVSAVYKIKGDANLDDKIDLADTLVTIKVLFDSTSPLKTDTMDCNKTATGYGDGKIDLFDILEILSLIFS